MKDLIWTTKQGEEIPVCEMSEAHAKNIVRYIIRLMEDGLIDLNDYSSDPDATIWDTY